MTRFDQKPCEGLSNEVAPWSHHWLVRLSPYSESTPLSWIDHTYGHTSRCMGELLSRLNTNVQVVSPQARTGRQTVLTRMHVYGGRPVPHLQAVFPVVVVIVVRSPCMMEGGRGYDLQCMSGMWLQ